MKILADENIPLAREAFSHLGEVHHFTGRSLQAEQVRDADLLLVRSVTRVNEALLAGSHVQFVGSATIGFDHIDRDYLRECNIGFTSAPGCNAISAAEYVVSVLMVLSQQQGFAWQDKTVGIIGCGNVGSRVQKRLQALGLHCLINDPPRAEQEGQTGFVELDDLLEQADIVTLHIPLEKRGKHPTLQLADTEFFAKMKNDGIFINTSRGNVMVQEALKDKQQAHTSFTTVLDVWENEPDISTQMLATVALGTPHIAGYSFDGKLRGTEMLYRAVCKYFQLDSQWTAAPYLPPAPVSHVYFSESADDATVLRQAVWAAYDVRVDDAQLRCLPNNKNMAQYFDSLRKNYPLRREFAAINVHLPVQREKLAAQLNALGFQVHL